VSLTRHATRYTRINTQRQQTSEVIWRKQAYNIQQFFFSFSLVCRILLALDASGATADSAVQLFVSDCCWHDALRHSACSGDRLLESLNHRWHGRRSAGLCWSKLLLIVIRSGTGFVIIA
jgi:hypothetical protein